MTQTAIATLTTIEQAELTAHEAVIERGLQTFYEVGEALMSIRDKRLYRAEFGTFEDYCRTRWQIDRRRAYQLMDAAQVFSNVQNFTQTPPLMRESHTVPLASLPAEDQPVVWQRAVETAPNGKVTAEHVTRVVEEFKSPLVHGPMGDYREVGNGIKRCEKCGQLWAADLDYCPYCHISPEARVMFDKPTRPENLHVSDDSYEWYTPKEYIEAARRTMGSIDTDPASCKAANVVVKAGRIFTAEDDGLAHEWRGNVWVNPPYNMPLIEQFCDKAIAEYEGGRAKSVIFLANNSTDTGWFHKLLGACSVMLLTKGRIRFWSEGGEILATRQGQAIFYLGAEPARFAAEFAQYGAVLKVE